MSILNQCVLKSNKAEVLQAIVHAASSMVLHDVRTIFQVLKQQLENTSSMQDNDLKTSSNYGELPPKRKPNWYKCKALQTVPRKKYGNQMYRINEILRIMMIAWGLWLLFFKPRVIFTEPYTVVMMEMSRPGSPLAMSKEMGLVAFESPDNPFITLVSGMKESLLTQTQLVRFNIILILNYSHYCTLQ